MPDERTVRIGLGDAGGNIVGREPGPAGEHEQDIGNCVAHTHHRIDQGGVIFVGMRDRRE